MKFRPLSNRTVRAVEKKKRVPLRVRFRLRAPKPGESYRTPHPLQCVITINSKKTHGFGAVWPLNGTGEKIQVDPKKWDAKQQSTLDESDLANGQIVELRKFIKSIYATQCKIGKPDFLSVRYELQFGIAPDWVDDEGWQYPEIDLQIAPQKGICHSGSSSITSVFGKYIELLESRTGSQNSMSRITIGRWKRTLLLLKAFATEVGQPEPELAKVTVGWSRRFHAWLQDQQVRKHGFIPLHPMQANRFLSKLREVLQWSYEEGWIDKNPLVGVKWPRVTEQKEILFLEVEHVQLLMRTRWQGSETVALWWFCLMCYTGLDYPDVIDYARNRGVYETLGPAGWKIVGRRKKPPHNKFYVPLQPEVLQLFEVYPAGPEDYSPQCVNRKTHLIQELLGITWRITARTARKTFGCMMLAQGYRIADVSGMMAHSRVDMTEKHYVDVSETAIDRAMLRVQGSTTPDSALPAAQARNNQASVVIRL